jgi:Thioredoxin-like
MVSPYINRVESYGGHWHRPWFIFLFLLTVPLLLHWLMREKSPEAQFVCESLPGSRYRAAVEIDDLKWTGDMEAALACAFKEGRRVFVAFHAVTDVNARVNEVTVFRDSRVKLAIRDYALVMLYVDLVPDRFYRQEPDRQAQRKDGEANFKFLEQHFQTAQEPLYAVLQPTANGDFEIVGQYDEARINDLNLFVQFLKNPAQTRTR